MDDHLSRILHLANNASFISFSYVYPFSRVEIVGDLRFSLLFPLASLLLESPYGHLSGDFRPRFSRILNPRSDLSDVLATERTDPRQTERGGFTRRIGEPEEGHGPFGGHGPLPWPT